MEERMAAWPATRLGPTQWPPSSLTWVSAHIHRHWKQTQHLLIYFLYHVHRIALDSLYGTDVFLFFAFLESPVVSVAFSEILIGVGEATVMACSASGIPQPEIWWYKGSISEDGTGLENKEKWKLSTYSHNQFGLCISSTHRKRFFTKTLIFCYAAVLALFCRRRKAPPIVPLGGGHIGGDADHQGDPECRRWRLHLLGCQRCWHRIRTDLSERWRWERDQVLFPVLHVANVVRLRFSVFASVFSFNICFKGELFLPSSPIG